MMRHRERDSNSSSENIDFQSLSLFSYFLYIPSDFFFVHNDDGPTTLFPVRLSFHSFRAGTKHSFFLQFNQRQERRSIREEDLSPTLLGIFAALRDGDEGSIEITFAKSRSSQEMRDER